MNLSLKKRKINGKDRIILEFKPKDKLEKKVMRSIASANFGKKIVLKHNPLIELKFISDQKSKNIQRMYPPAETRPEVEEATKLPCLIDQEEYDSAIRTAKAQTLAKSLGIKIPQHLKKKFYCRCELTFTNPSEFLSHRKLCPILRTEVMKNADIVRERIIKECIVATPAAKIKELYPCRCGHEFPTKKMCSNHQKLCSVIKECTDLFARCKEYIESVKHEGQSSKYKDKKKRMGQRNKDASTKRKPRRKSLTKRTVS